MMDAAHLRAQAELCFAIAELVSDRAAANQACLAAEQYVRRAGQAEQEKLARLTRPGGFGGRRASP